MRRLFANRTLHIAAALVALLVACAVFPTSVLAFQQSSEQSSSEENVQVKVFQKYQVTTSGLQNTFVYNIVSEDASSPMPVRADGTTFNSFSLTRDEEMWLLFPTSAFVGSSTSRATHHYLLEPAQTDLPDGLYYVDVFSTSLEKGVNRYYLDIDVIPSADNPSQPMIVPTVHIEGWDGPKVTDPGWRVAYEAPASKDDPSKDSTSKDKPSDQQKSSAGDNTTGENVTGENGDGKDAANGASGTSSTSGSTGKTATNISRSDQATAKTGDTALGVTSVVSIGCIVLLAGLWLTRRKAGNEHE